MSLPFKWFNICLAGLMAVLAVGSSIAAVRYIVVRSKIIYPFYSSIFHMPWQALSLNPTPPYGIRLITQLQLGH